MPAPLSELNRTHVRFQWDVIEGSHGYELEVVLDDGSPDPFAGGAPVFAGESIGALPRLVAQSGLEWGNDYAWRVRGLAQNGDPGAWGDTERFSVVELPPDLPLPTVAGPEGGGDVQPGLTLFNTRSPAGLFAGGYALAADQDGDIVWLIWRESGINDVRQLDNGHVLYDTGNPVGSGGIAEISTIDDEIVWQSPEGGVHHEAFQMPNGNILALVFGSMTLPDGEGGELTWLANRLVEWDYETKEIVWEWSEFENYSFLDFDEFSGPGGDWTHSNSVTYNPEDNSVYLSARNLSRGDAHRL